MTFMTEMAPDSTPAAYFWIYLPGDTTYLNLRRSNAGCSVFHWHESHGISSRGGHLDLQMSGTVHGLFVYSHVLRILIGVGCIFVYLCLVFARTEKCERHIQLPRRPVCHAAEKP